MQFKIKKKIITTTLVLIGIFLVGFSILTFLGFFKEQQSGLLIESDPQSVVLIDNVEVGTTPYETNRPSGDVTVKMRPQINNNNEIDDYETKVTLLPGIKTIIKRTFRENEDETSGEIVSFEKISKNKAMVSIVSTPNKAKVLVDGQMYGYTPIELILSAGNHDLVLSLDGFTDMKLPLKLYKGYKITASVKLSEIKTDMSN